MQPQPGDFQLAPIGDAVGELIKLGQWLNGDGLCPYQHARVYIGGGLFVEAEPGGAAMNPHAFTDGMMSTGLIPLTGIQREYIVTSARQYATQRVPYSALDYFALAAHRLHIPAPGLQHYIADTGHMICSQLVDQCYANASVHLFTDGRWPGFVTPADLYNLLMARKRAETGT